MKYMRNKSSIIRVPVRNKSKKEMYYHSSDNHYVTRENRVCGLQLYGSCAVKESYITNDYHI